MRFILKIQKEHIIREVIAMKVNGIGTKPTIEGLNQLDAAVLLEKYTLLLGMINFGSQKQKEQAKTELETIEGYVNNHVNAISFELANLRLQLTEEELGAIEKAV